MAEAAPAPPRRATWSDEAQRSARHPLSRWYVCPAAQALAALLAPTRVRPWQVTLANLALAVCAAALLVATPALAPLAALFVWLAWCCDRLDGPLARRQGTASALGGWLDAQVDELNDVLWHAAAAWALAAQQGVPHAPWLLAAFLSGKFLLFRGLPAGRRAAVASRSASSAPSLARRLVQGAGNADVRLHLLVACWLCGALWIELFVTAVYFQARWLARAARKLRQARAAAPPAVA